MDNKSFQELNAKIANTWLGFSWEVLCMIYRFCLAIVTVYLIVAFGSYIISFIVRIIHG